MFDTLYGGFRMEKDMSEPKAVWLEEVLFEVGKQLEKEGCKREAVAVFRLNAALHRSNTEPHAPTSTPGEVDIWFDIGEDSVELQPKLRVEPINVHRL